MKIGNILFFLLHVSLLISNESFDSFTVKLETESKQVPLYLAHFQKNEPQIEKNQIDELEKVLKFDLTHGGYIRLISDSKGYEQLIKKQKDITSSDLKELSKDHIQYLVVIRIDGNKLSAKIYSAVSGWIKGIQDVELMNDNHKNRQLIHRLSDSIHRALFGIDGIATTKVIYTVRNKIPGKNEWNSNIYEMDYDGFNPRQILYNAGYIVTPQYIPATEGMRPGNFVFVSYKTGEPKIFLGFLNGKAPKRLTYLKGNQLMPTLSYQRDQLAFISDIPGNPELFLLPISKDDVTDKKPRQIFSARHATQGTPTFSPDGKRIAFVSNKDGSARIYVMDVPKEKASKNDLRPKLITKYRRGCTAPSWSYDGKKIAYCARVDGFRQIFVYDLFKEVEIQVTRGRGDKENPTWASDSLHLIYNCHNGSKCELFMTNLNQKQAVQITNGTGEKRFPHWEPVLNLATRRTL